MLVNKAIKDKRYGKTKANRDIDSIHASSITHSIEDTTPVPRTRSLPLPRGAQINNTGIAKAPVPRLALSQHGQSSSKESSHSQSVSSKTCCVVM